MDGCPSINGVHMQSPDFTILAASGAVIDLLL
jgi:hypothetical protein